MRYKMDSIIFDLDGTLWNSVDTILRAWNDYLKGQSQISKILTRTDFEGAMGLQIDAIDKRFFLRSVIHTGHSFWKVVTEKKLNM